MRYQLDCPILSHEQVGESEFEVLLHAPEIARCARAGQFLQILYDHSYRPYTRRPFSVFKTDVERGTVAIVYLARGLFTQGLRARRPGESLSVVGPLGNRFVPARGAETRHLLVAGGVGAPPLYLLAREMLLEGYAEDSIHVINGARSAGLLVASREFEALGVNVEITTEDGSRGRRGLVTEALRELLASSGSFAVYTCGPTAMLRAVAEVCRDHGAPCQVSVETVMPCGMGVCMGCVVKIVDAAAPGGFRMLRSCYEGPVFPAEAVLWD